MDHENDARRDMIRREMREGLEFAIEERLERYLDVEHKGVIANHHFADASSECINVYRDGYFISAAMVSQSVTEGIWKFVLDRNQIPFDADCPALAAKLVQSGVLSQDCADAFTRIWRSFRNDVHHMNPSVIKVPFREIARRNLKDLAVIEHEIFAVTFDNGSLVPIQPRYWDIQPGGMTEVFLRNPWVSDKGGA